MESPRHCRGCNISGTRTSNTDKTQTSCRSIFNLLHPRWSSPQHLCCAPSSFAIAAASLCPKQREYGSQLLNRPEDSNSYTKGISLRWGTQPSGSSDKDVDLQSDHESFT